MAFRSEVFPMPVGPVIIGYGESLVAVLRYRRISKCIF